MPLGDPVSGTDFFGRNHELKLLASTLEEFRNKEKRNLALIGIRKIGKTSIIKEFIQRLNASEPDVICLDVYLQEQSPLNFFRSCMGAMVLEMARSVKRRIIPDMTLEQAMKTVENDFPRSSVGLVNLRNYIAHNNLDEAFGYLFQVFDTLRAETKKPVIVFLDEFQRLQGYNVSIESPIDRFREKIMNQKEILYVISGSAVGMLNELISSTSSPLYGHFERLMVGEFDFKDARQFMIKKKTSHLSMGEVHLSFLYEITNGNPFYLDVLVHRLNRYCKFNETGRITDKAIEEALLTEVFSVQGSIYSHFSSLLEQSLEKRGPQYYKEILKSIASGNRRPSRISKNTGMKITTMPHYLRKLQELQLIGRSNLTKKNSMVAEYVILDPLFELWLNYVYSVRQNPLLRDVSAKMQVFRDNVSEILQAYNSELGRGNESRIRELFRAFDNDDLMGLKIPKFDSVERFTFKNQEIDVFCKTNDETWVGEISKGKIDRAEIEKLKEKISNIPEENGKKVKEIIVIALKDVTSNAVAYSKELGYHVWTMEEINHLLKRKGMFRILI